MRLNKKEKEFIAGIIGIGILVIGLWIWNHLTYIISFGLIGIGFIVAMFLISKYENYNNWFLLWLIFSISLVIYGVNC